MANTDPVNIGTVPDDGTGDTIRAAFAKYNAHEHDSSFSVMNFGAAGDGVADDTPAIQAAITHAGETGGGRVFMPPGTYKIMPQVSGQHALYIAWSNVELCGAGMGVTKLLFRGFGDADPATTWELIGGEVWRGFGISVQYAIPGFTQTETIRNLVFRDFELDGGLVGNTGNTTFPANITTGDGWDITHKGISLPEVAAAEDVLFERVHVHDFRGELLFRAGGDDCKRVKVLGSRIGGTNANGINLSVMDREVVDTLIYDCAGAATEDVMMGHSIFSNVRVRSCAFGLIFGALDGYNVQVSVTGCHLYDVEKGGIVALCGNATIIGNTLIDCGWRPGDGKAIAVTTVLPNVVQYNPDRRGVIVSGNTIKAETKRCEIGIYIGGNSASPVLDTIVSNNVLSRGPDNTEDFLFGFMFDMADVACRNVVVRGNTLETKTGSGGAFNGQYLASEYIPLIGQDNLFRPRLSPHTTEVPKITGGGTEPLWWPEVKFDNQVGVGATPTINAALYEKGYRVKIRGENPAPTIAARATGWCLQAERILVPNTELTVEFDGERFVEVDWIDKT